MGPAVTTLIQNQEPKTLEFQNTAETGTKSARRVNFQDPNGEQTNKNR